MGTAAERDVGQGIASERRTKQSSLEGNKRRQKGNKVDTVTNKKGDKGRQEGDKADTVTNKKRGTVTDKTANKGRQEGDKADTMTNKKAGGYAVPQQGHQQRRHRTWETKGKKLHGRQMKGKGDTSSAEPGRQR